LNFVDQKFDSIVADLDVSCIGQASPNDLKAISRRPRRSKNELGFLI
jgi:hypothetical protein